MTLKLYHNIDWLLLKDFRLSQTDPATGRPYTQQDIARAIGKKQSYISRLEKGHYKLLQHKFLEELASAFGLSVKDFVSKIQRRELALQSRVMDDDTLTKHRAFIAIKAQALMGRFFQLPQDELVKRDILLGWMDMLQDFTADEITKACADYLIEHPTKRPHEGLVRQMLVNNRKRYVAAHPVVQLDAPPRKSQDAEERKRISQEMMAKLGKKW